MCLEQEGDRGYNVRVTNEVSDTVKREITQGLFKIHGADKGIAVACKFVFFETCEEILLHDRGVLFIACL